MEITHLLKKMNYQLNEKLLIVILNEFYALVYLLAAQLTE